MHAFYYCTHSLGPLIHITGLRPVSVTGFESQMTERHLRCGSKAGQYGIEMVTLENGGQSLIRVRDNGAGIPPERRKTIFEVQRDGWKPPARILSAAM